MRAVILGCLVLAACGGSSPSSPSHQPTLRLTAAISQAVLREGDMATLTFSLQNVGSSTVEVRFASSCQISPYIANKSGAVVYPGSGTWACALVLTALSLTPGEVKVEQLRIRGGLSALSSVYGLPPGQYVAYARIDGSYTLQSEPVAFTVVDR